VQKKLFITGIGTGVGKTICSAVLVQYFEADYWKPVQSGDLFYTDSMAVKDMTGEGTQCHPETYRLKLAASPHQSASAEGKLIKVSDFELPKTEKNLIVEGAGGLMVPLSDDELMIDLMEKLNIPVVLVVREYLGCINHSLLSIMALKQRGLQLEYLVLNGHFPHDTERVICAYLDAKTKIIRIPEIEKQTKENIENITKQLKNL
jgi:dethiobiotin synthetase